MSNDIFRHLNKILRNNNSYYCKAEALIERQPWPKSKKELKEYKKKVKDIVDDCIDHAFKATQPILT